MNKILSILFIMSFETAAAAGVIGAGGNGGAMAIESEVFTTIERNLYDDNFIVVDKLGDLKAVATFTTVDGEPGVVVRTKDGRPGMVIQNSNGTAKAILEKIQEK